MRISLACCTLTSVAVAVAGQASGEVSKELRPLVARTYATDVAGDRAFVATTVGMRIVDIRRPNAPRLLGTLVVPDSLNDIRVRSGHAFLAAGPHGVVIANVRDPSRPQRVARVDTPGSANGLDVSDKRLFVADGSFGVAVYDITEPARPKRLAQWDTGCYTRDIVVDARHLYVACGRKGLLLYSAKLAKRPLPITRLSVPGLVRRLSLSGPNRLVAAASAAGVHLIEIGSPPKPRRLLSLPSLDAAHDAVVQGKRLIVADGEAGVRLFDLVEGNKAMPRGRYETRAKRSANGVAIVGQRALVAYDSAGLHLLRISAGGLKREAIFPPKKSKRAGKKKSKATGKSNDKKK